MTEIELIDKIKDIKEKKFEGQTIELKAEHHGCTKKLYDTLSSFSNQDDGGTIIFGIDEDNDYDLCGVYDANDLQKQINNKCLQMEPIVRPVLTVAKYEGKHFVSAEIPAIDVVDRPCFYKGVGRIKGSYIRVGDSDEQMTEYEIYSFEAYRKKYQDDIRTVERTSVDLVDEKMLSDFLVGLKNGKPNLAKMSDDMLMKLYRVVDEEKLTLSSLMVFCHFPQAFFPQLAIHAISVPGTELGDINIDGERFIDNQKIEGCISDMLDAAISFVRRNMKNSTRIDSITGKRIDRPEYPIVAVREALLNALVHRDYSIHTEGKPIQLIMYSDRLEIKNPGGIYGRITIDQLGKVQPDTRNPVMVNQLEMLGVTENRYSGIPTIKKAMKEAGLVEPIFREERGEFIVTLSNKETNMLNSIVWVTKKNPKYKMGDKELLAYLSEERTRQEIVDFLGMDSVTYAMQKYINPLIEAGKVKYTIPEKPKSRNQRYIAVKE